MNEDREGARLPGGGGCLWEVQGPELMCRMYWL